MAKCILWTCDLCNYVTGILACFAHFAVAAVYKPN